MSTIVNKSIIDVMVESASAEEYELNDLFDDEIEKDFTDEIDSIEELEESLLYTADMVPVIAHEGKFYVDISDVYRIMECGDCDEDDECDVVDKIVDANDDEGMTMENTYIMIESTESMMGYVNEARAAAKKGGISVKAGKAKLTAAKDVFKNLKNKGLKLVKKKGKTKKK